MATTSLIVETLIAGFQALVGLILWLLLFRGTTWINSPYLKDWVNLLLLFAITIAYTLGIIIERAASFLMHAIDDRSAKATQDKQVATEAKATPPGAKIRQFFRLLLRVLPQEQRFQDTKMRMEIMEKNPAISSYLEGYRYQYRLLAAITINLLLYMVPIFLALLLAWIKPSLLAPEKIIQDFAKHAWVALVILLVLFLLTVWLWGHMRRNLYKQLQEAHAILFPPQSQPPH